MPARRRMALATALVGAALAAPSAAVALPGPAGDCPADQPVCWHDAGGGVPASVKLADVATDGVQVIAVGTESVPVPVRSPFCTPSSRMRVRRS